MGFLNAIAFPEYNANPVNKPPIKPEISNTIILGTDNKRPILSKTMPFKVRSKYKFAPNQVKKPDKKPAVKLEKCQFLIVITIPKIRTGMTKLHHGKYSIFLVNISRGMISNITFIVSRVFFFILISDYKLSHI